MGGYYVHSFPIGLNGNGPVPVSVQEGSLIVGVYGPEHGAGHANARVMMLCPGGVEDGAEERRERWFVAAKLGSTIATGARIDQFKLIGVVHANQPVKGSMPWAIMEVDEWAM